MSQESLEELVVKEVQVQEKEIINEVKDIISEVKEIIKEEILEEIIITKSKSLEEIIITEETLVKVVVEEVKKVKGLSWFQKYFSCFPK